MLRPASSPNDQFVSVDTSLFFDARWRGGPTACADGGQLARRRAGVFSVLIFLVVGLLAVTIAKALVPGRDPGVGISLMLGAVAQILVWFGSRWTGLERYGQPWSFFL